ncbi:MAG: DUF177 domain-containing protein, partial [Thermonemataceae bacterium]|nr:DUF177 domain-containing protein [Thermonemataceae bacterium]
MEKLKKYDIAIAKLQNKTYQYSWEDDKNFFANFEESLVESATFKVKLELVKSDVLLRLNFNI